MTPLWLNPKTASEAAHLAGTLLPAPRTSTDIAPYPQVQRAAPRHVPGGEDGCPGAGRARAAHCRGAEAASEPYIPSQQQQL